MTRPTGEERSRSIPYFGRGNNLTNKHFDEYARLVWSIPKTLPNGLFLKKSCVSTVSEQYAPSGFPNSKLYIGNSMIECM